VRYNNEKSRDFTDPTLSAGNVAVSPFSVSVVGYGTGIVQLVYVSHYIVSFILLYCNFHLSFNHCIFALLCVLYVLFYCTNPAFGCYISINFFFFFFNDQHIIVL